MPSAPVTFLDAVRAALRDELAADPNVVLLGEDIGAYGGAFGVTRGLIEEFGPGRVRDFPISEAAMTGMAVGAAMLGLRPVIEIMFMDFVSLTVDAMCNHAAKIHYMFNGQYRAPMVLRAPMGAGRGYGPSHSQSLLAWFAHVPGLKLVVPGCAADAYGLLRAAIRDDNPVLFLEHKLLYGVADNAELPCEARLGEARVARKGTDVTIVTFGMGVQTAQAAAEALAARGVELEIVNLRTLRPLDIERVTASCRRTGHAIVLSEEYPFCSVASELAASIQETCWRELNAPVLRVTGADTTIPCAPSLERAWLPGAERLIAAVHRSLGANTGGEADA